jgi:AMIN domain
MSTAATLKESRQTCASVEFTPDANPNTCKISLEQICVVAMILTGGSAAAIASFDNDGISYEATVGDAAAALLDTRNLCRPAFWQESFHGNEVMVWEDSDLDNIAAGQEWKTLGIRSLLAAPIGNDAEIGGVLQIFAERPGAFENADAHILNRLAKIAYTAANGNSQFRAAQRSHEVADVIQEPQNELQDFLFVQRLCGRLLARREQLAIVSGVFLLICTSAFLLWIGGNPPHSTRHMSRDFLLFSKPVSSRHENAPTPHASPPAALRTSRPDVEAQITTIDWVSEKEETKILIRLDGAVSFESRGLQGPNRIFVDLYPARLAPDLLSSYQKIFRVNDNFVWRVRVAQRDPQRSRVVIDLKVDPESAKASLVNPNSLMITIGPREHALEAAN